MSIAQAQSATAAAPQTADTAIQEVVVTGTRIRGVDAKAANPISVIGAADIAKTKATTIEEALRNTPAVDFSGGISANTNNGGLGASNVGLRNLGPARTLILLDGLRFPFTDTQGSTAAVDLNNIPVQMIDHIDVLRNGASSIYGADALSGVINIITKKHQDGLQIDTSAGYAADGPDGVTYSVAGTMGVNFDRGNILINIDHDQRDPIAGTDRSWYTDEHANADVLNYANISSRITGAIGVIGGTKYYFPNGLNSSIPAANAYTLGNLIPGLQPAYSGGGLTPGNIAIPGAGVYFDYLPTEYITGSLNRKQANFVGHYDITPDITATADFFYTNRQSQQELNPEPLGYNVFTQKYPNGLVVPARLPDGTLNPYNPTNQANSLATYGVANTDVPILTRRFEDGPRVYSDDISTYRAHVALNGTVLDNYDWAVGYFYGQSTATYRVANEVNLQHALQLTGELPCNNDVQSGCSVANFFGYNSLTPAQAQYLVFTNTDTSEYDESEAYANINGPIYDLPYGTIKGVLGFEYRTESGFDHPDSVVANGDSTVSASPTQGSYDVASGYGELNIPILKDLPLVKKLTADVSGRYDYYTTFGRALTWKAGLDYQITDDFRLRGSRSTAFRAPQIKELYGGNFQTSPGGNDPCAAGGAYTTSPQCLVANGGNPASLTQVNQLSGIGGGNSRLKPETAQEWTVGGVWTPRQIPGFSLAVDYYDILVRDEISTYNPNSLLSLCYGGVQYIVSYTTACTGSNALVTRQGANGTGNLGFVYILNENVGNEQTNGIDIDMAYGFDTSKVGLSDGGRIDLNGEANYLLSDNLVNSFIGTVTQQAGTEGFDSLGQDAEPRWKATLSGTYSNGPFLFNWTTRYYGGVKVFQGEVAGVGDFEGNEAAGIFYHDINVTYHYNNMTASFGIDNLFDKDPPYLVTSGSTSIENAGYDFVGRFIYTKFKITF